MFTIEGNITQRHGSLLDSKNLAEMGRNSLQHSARGVSPQKGLDQAQEPQMSVSQSHSVFAPFEKNAVNRSDGYKSFNRASIPTKTISTIDWN